MNKWETAFKMYVEGLEEENANKVFKAVNEMKEIDPELTEKIYADDKEMVKEWFRFNGELNRLKEDGITFFNKSKEAKNFQSKVNELGLNTKVVNHCGRRFFVELV